MASHGSLPLYYKNSKPTGLPGPTKSWKDNYLLVVVFVGFMILIAGTFWYLPPLEDKDSDYEKTYGRFTGNPSSYITDVVIPSEPTLEPPEATAEVSQEEEGHLEDVGGRVEDDDMVVIDGVEIKDNVDKFVENVPVRLEDLIGEKDAQIFEKQPSETTGPPETTRPPETERPPEENKVNEHHNEGAPAVYVVPADSEDGAKDLEADERRRKVVEVSCSTCCEDIYIYML